MITCMENSLSIIDLKNSITELPKEYDSMIAHIQEALPSIKKSSEGFYKTKSQFANVTIDITDLTPISSIKHVLACIEKTKLALAESQINRRKTEIKLKKKQKKLETCKDEFDRELIELEIIEIMHGVQTGDNYIKGAIRQLSFYVTQYNSLMSVIGKEFITEEDYELEEKKYHVATALKQALCSARPRGGIIDEGNFIYFFELGINGGHVQAEVFNYLKQENDLIENGKAPTHEMTLQWIEGCVEKFMNESEKFIALRGFKSFDEKSLSK